VAVVLAASLASQWQLTATSAKEVKLLDVEGKRLKVVEDVSVAWSQQQWYRHRLSNL